MPRRIVDSEDDCKKAANMFDLAYRGSVTYTNTPAGCFSIRKEFIEFNTILNPNLTNPSAFGYCQGICYGPGRFNKRQTS